MLSFSLDKETYNIGDEVVVTIPQAVAGARALAAIENGSEVLKREWVTLTPGSDTKYTFKVTDKMSPNVYLHISLLQPHAAAGDLPIRMYGIMPIMVSDKESVLTPVITMSDVLKPETDFEVKVKEQSGKPMTYTLAIVDDGLLDLTNFRTPDPWKEFYAREALGIRTWDMFDYVIGAYTGKYGSLFSVGGDEDLNPLDKKANRFKPVVLYLGPVSLAQGETKTHRLRLPSYVGSVRVMVVGGQNGAYGKVDKTVAVRSPLMLLSSLPRVLSTGEKISLPVNVFAMEDGIRNVNVKVETTGKLKAVDSNSQSVSFNATGDKTVYFSMQTGSDTGIETVTVTASGGGHVSKETIEIEVRNPNPPSLRYESKTLEKGKKTEFSYSLDNAYSGNWVKFEASRIPAMDLSRRIDYLYDYSHFCTEQLTSRAMPLLFLPDLTDLDDKETTRLKTNITGAISNLYGRQLSNGGFCYWPGEGFVNDWISSYAGSFLVMARERGYSVNNNVINRWISYQRSTARSWQHNTTYQSDLMQAYRLYSLALAGSPEMSAMNRLKEIKNLSSQAKWRLAAAYALSGKQDAANDLIFNASTAVESYSRNNPTYGSAERDEALILETLVLLDKTDAALRQAIKISKNLSGEKYFSTQSTAYAMVAMGQLASKISGQFDFDWSLNGSKQGRVTTNKAVFNKQIPTKPASGKITVENGNAGALYVSIAVKSRPVIDNLPAVNENIKLEVSYCDMAGNSINPASIEQGDDFQVIIKVSNISGSNNYSDVALTHIIPSGWEIYNERMIDDIAETKTDNSITYQDIRDDRVLTYFDLPAGKFKQIKVRLQASYKGEFVLPAILCEAMYDTSAHARTKAGKVTVK